MVSDSRSSHPLEQKAFEMSSQKSDSDAAEKSVNKSLLRCLGETAGALGDTETVSDNITNCP